MKKQDQQLLIRLDAMTKKAFLKACKANDLSAAQVLRKFIHGYVKDNNHNLLLDLD